MAAGRLHRAPVTSPLTNDMFIRVAASLLGSHRDSQRILTISGASRRILNDLIARQSGNFHESVTVLTHPRKERGEFAENSSRYREKGNSQRSTVDFKESYQRSTPCRQVLAVASPLDGAGPADGRCCLEEVGQVQIAFPSLLF